MNLTQSSQLEKAAADETADAQLVVCGFIICITVRFRFGSLKNRCFGSVSVLSKPNCGFGFVICFIVFSDLSVPLTNFNDD